MTADTGRRSVTRPDGRVVEFLVAGPAEGLPLVLHEGTPCGLVRRRPARAGLPGARVHVMPGDGHLSMTVSAFDRILDDLLDLAGLNPQAS